MKLADRLELVAELSRTQRESRQRLYVEIRLAREQGATLAQLAAAAGVTPMRVSQIARGIR